MNAGFVGAILSACTALCLVCSSALPAEAKINMHMDNSDKDWNIAFFLNFGTIFFMGSSPFVGGAFEPLLNPI